MRKLYLSILFACMLLIGNKILAQCSVTISTNPNATTQLDCTNSTIVLRANEAGTTGLVNYLWNTNEITQMIFADNPDTFTVTITDALGCTSSVSITITQDINPPNVSIQANSDTVCSGQTVTLTGSGAATYTWASPISTSGPVVMDNPTQSTTYTVTGKGSNGCTADATKQVIVDVSVPTVSDPDPLATQQLCLNQQAAAIQVIGSGSTVLSYQWYGNTIPGNTTGTILTGATGSSYTPLTNTAGTLYYYCVVTGRCISDTSAVSAPITVNSLPVVSITGNNSFCPGGSTTLTANLQLPSGNQIYQWQINGIDIAGATASTFIAVVPGAYTVVVTDNGCTGTSSIFPVTISTPPVTNITGNGSICQSGNTVLNSNATTATGTIISYQWQLNGIDIPGATNVTYTATAPGDYTVLVTNSAGCSTTSPAFTVTVNSLPTATISGTSTVCQNSNSPQIVFAGAGGTGPYTFSYTIDGGPLLLISNGTNSAIINAPTGTQGQQVYELINVIDNNGCSAQPPLPGDTKDTIFVEPGALLISPHAVNVCSDSTFIYTAISTATGFSWQRENPLPPGITSLSVVGASGTNAIIRDTLHNDSPLPIIVKYNYTLTVGSNCITTDTLFVTVNPTTVIDLISNKTFCNEDTVAGINFTSTTPNTTFTWTCNPSIGFGTGPVTASNISSFFAQNDGDLPIMAHVTVTASSNNCGQAITDFFITVNPSPPAPDFNWPGNGGFSALCLGAENINFNIISPVDDVSYLWNTIPLNNQNVSIHDVNDPNTTISFLSSGIHAIQVVAINPLGCKDSVKHLVEVSNLEGIEERKIFKKQPGNLLVYPDNSMSSYQWGYDSLLHIIPDTAYGPPVNVDGQVYQFFIPTDRFIINNELDTIQYAYWVLLNEGGCNSKVYYNGPYAGGRIQYIPPVDTNVHLNVFPNPNNGIFDIVLKGDIYGSMNAKIYNAMGQIVFSNSFNKSAGEMNKNFNVGNLSGGLYYLVIKSSDLKKITARFIIQ